MATGHHSPWRALAAQGQHEEGGGRCADGLATPPGRLEADIYPALFPPVLLAEEYGREGRPEEGLTVLEEVQKAREHHGGALV